VSVAPVGPDYSGAWRTADELGFVENLGRHRSPAWTPADAVDSRAYRVACLMGYLAAFEARAIRGSVDWQTVKERAVDLLVQAREQAA